MESPQSTRCPDCDAGLTRREFIAVAGSAVAAATVAAIAPAAHAMPPIPQAAKTVASPESLVKTFYNSLSPGQREKICLPYDNGRRAMVNANWAIIDPTIGDTFNGEQKEMVHGIVKAVTSEEWYPKFLKQWENDGGGIDNYHAALFGDPNSGRAEMVLTGRHATMRAGADVAGNMAFGGPIFYGHAPKDTEDPTHPGNLYWFQAKRANEVFQMLDGKQRAEALIQKAPGESAVSFRKSGDVPGIAVATMSRDQKAHVEKVMRDLLAPYRKADVDDVLENVKANGGLDTLHLAFFKQEDLGNDGVWDIWRLEGRAFVWHFRGAPHVHTWVNIARKA